MASPELPYFLQYEEVNEVKVPTATKVEGTIPKWLRGMLVRNGSGKFNLGHHRVRHLFDGLSVLHKFIIEDGNVKYQCRMLDSDTWKRCVKAQCFVDGMFGTPGMADPCRSIFTRYFHHFLESTTNDNTAVNIIAQGDRLVAMTETPKVNIVDPQTLTKRGQVDLSKLVAVGLATAHPHVERDGTMYNLGTNFSPNHAYNILRVPPKTDERPEPFEEAEIIAKIPSRWKFNISYNHSFGMSAQHFVVLEQTLTMNTLRLMSHGLTGGSFEESFLLHDTHHTLFHVVHKSDGKVIKTKYAAKSFFCFHFINCFEEDGFLVVDLSGYTHGTIVKHLYLNNIIENAEKIDDDPPRYRRYVIPLDVEKAEVGKNLVTLSYTTATAVKHSDGSVHLTFDEIIPEREDLRLELPRINDNYIGVRHRYVYGTSLLGKESQLCKVDVEEREELRWRESGMMTGEPIFVPAPNAKAEDDGVVISTVMSESEDMQGFLLVLDAKTFSEVGRATIPKGAKIPGSFHGCFTGLQK